MPEDSATETRICTRTLRLKVKPEAYAWLNAAAIETSQVWNFSNAASETAARPFAGRGKWLSACVEKIQSGRRVVVVNERITTRECGDCHALTAAAGVQHLDVRIWVLRKRELRR